MTDEGDYPPGIGDPVGQLGGDLEQTAESFADYLELFGQIRGLARLVGAKAADGPHEAPEGRLRGGLRGGGRRLAVLGHPLGG